METLGGGEEPRSEPRGSAATDTYDAFMVTTPARAVRTRLRMLTTTALTLALLTGCSTNLPNSVQASIGPPIDAGVDSPVVHLHADVGGGCNVEGTYTIEVETSINGTTQVITIGSHDYRSDGEECADLASAEAKVQLDPGFLSDDLDTLSFDLDGQMSSFRLSVVDGIIHIEEIAGSNVTLGCSESQGELLCLRSP